MRLDPVLCCTPQAELAAQVSGALAPLGCQLEIAPRLDARRGALPSLPWSVILLDPAALPADWEQELSRWAEREGESTAGAAAAPAWLAAWQGWLALPSSPIPIWLGRERVPPQGILRLGILDIVHPILGLGKLAFVVRQQMAASHWRRLSRRRELETLPRLHENAFSLRHELYNPLVAILGNAELALQTRGRMPPELHLRLERIAIAAARIRDLLQAPQAAQSLPGSAA